MTLKKIMPDDLVLLSDYTSSHPLTIDLVYADAAHPENIFKTNIYKTDAKMWIHRELLPVVLRAAELCHKNSGYIFDIKDCLRTVDAQARMMETDVVKAHPEWTTEPDRMLAPPGKGGHPRAMAVDIILRDKNGDRVDMGTPFDYLTKTNNPSARAYTGFSSDVLSNRRILEDSMVTAARECHVELLPLPQEWWDFRFPNAYTYLFDPLNDGDLPAEMQMAA